MQEDKIYLEELQHTSLGELATLCETTYSGKEISNAKYLQWEYEQNPNGEALIAVRKEYSKVVAKYVVLPRSFSINQNIYRGSLSVNTLTHPEFRGRSLFPRLAEETFNRCKNEDIHFTLGFPNPKSFPVFLNKLSFHNIGRLSVLIKPMSVMRSVFKFSSDKNKMYSDEIDATIPVAKNAVITRIDLNEDQDLLQKFVTDFSKERDNLTHRSPEFLAWRYAKIPYRKYHLFKIVDRGVMTGLIVFRAKYVFGLRCGILVDFCLKKNVSHQNLFEYLQTIGVENKLDLILTAVPRHSPEFDLLRGNGFINTPSFLMPQKPDVIIRRHTTDCPDQIFDFSKWFLTFGDYDIF